jgi:radical SAM protein with 4Fe4S-binding SPASM domain
MKFSLIKRVLLHITDQCNLSCKHCYITSYKGTNFSFDKLKRDITGGEPFLFREFESYISLLANETDLKISSIFTNGTLLAKNVALLYKLYSYNKDLLFYISLDGYKDSHDAFRGNGTYGKALNGATLLKEIGFKVHINTILHNRVSELDLIKLYNEIIRKSFDRWRVDTPFNAGNWRSVKNDFSLTFEKAFNYFNLILKLCLQDSMPFDIEINHVVKFLDNTFYYLDKYSLEDPICPCKIFTIWPNGNITWCQDLYGEEFVIGNIDNDIEYLYEKYKTYKKRTIHEMLQNIHDCRKCGYIYYCGTGCRANSILYGGKYFDKDPEICHLFNSGLYKTIATTIAKYADITNQNK